MNISDTTIICIDAQEKLVNMLSDSEKTAKNITKMLKIASTLKIDTIITEQYPKGLGSTINSILEIDNFKTIEKTTFSALQTPQFEEEFQKNQNKNIIIFGIETHICVFQSVLDLIDKNYNVYVIKDCCASRNEQNHNCAIDFMRQKGANIMTLEMILFYLLKSSKHPNFKELQALIK